jgi:hypothetical protein
MGVMIRLLKIIAIIGVAWLMTGCNYFTPSRPAEAPKLNVIAELAKTQYQVGEEISVKPYLINMGERSITVFSGRPLLFVKVYDGENRQILSFPEVRLDILVEHTLSPNVPYYEGVYTFALEQPGRYKIVARAELSLDKAYADRRHNHADPIWIEVVTGSN